MTHEARKSLSLLPPFATTHIGSVPHTQLELALQYSLAFDLPALPELPKRDPVDFVLPHALAGFPGVSVDDQGTLRFDHQQWREHRRAPSAAVGRVPSAYGLPEFAFEIQSRQRAFAKTQLLGPFTARHAAFGTAGLSFEENAALSGDLLRWLLLRAEHHVQELKAARAVPVVFFDEPGLVALDLKNPSHVVSLNDLSLVIKALQNLGALVGVHCCGNTHFSSILALEPDILSVDFGLSFERLWSDLPLLQSHFLNGGTVAWGMVATTAPGGWQHTSQTHGEKLAQLLQSVEGAFLKTSWLTPACGLALSSVSHASDVLEVLRAIQQRLRGV